MNLKNLATFTLVACSALGIAACGDDGDNNNAADSSNDAADDTSDETVSSEPAPSGASAITIEGFAFAFPEEVAAGSVGVTNNDAAQHTITDDGGSFDFSIDANASTAIELAAGSYDVHCNIHPTMTGTLTVV